MASTYLKPITPLSLILTTILTMAIIAACSSAPKMIEQSPKITIDVKEPNRIRFQGKGAGAGMMMMGAMGPMGIAIGVAIDEGIGKEIDDSAKKAGFDIVMLIEQAFYKTLKNHPKPTNSINIQVERYGFKLKPGQGDPVLPEIQLIITINNTQTQTINYPDDLLNDTQPIEPLDKIKTQGELSLMLFQDALEKMAKKALAR